MNWKRESLVKVREFVERMNSNSEYYDEKIIKSVILHELTHYYLFISGSTKYSDGEKDFERESTAGKASGEKRVLGGVRTGA